MVVPRLAVPSWQHHGGGGAVLLSSLLMGAFLNGLMQSLEGSAPIVCQKQNGRPPDATESCNRLALQDTQCSAGLSGRTPASAGLAIICHRSM